MGAKFNKERTFGVEIEMAVNRRVANSISRTLNENDFDCEVTYYHSNINSRWKIESDNSCGYEIVSPILKGREGLNELKEVLEIVNEDPRVEVNTSCGVHVHHDIRDLEGKNVKRIYAIYHKFEDTIDSMVPKSRRKNNNSYCTSIKYTDNSRLHKRAETTINELNEVNTIEDIENLYRSRYLKVNCQSYREKGTLEFRQHSGSTDFEKIKNWILFTQAIVERSKTRTKLPKNLDYKYNNWERLQRTLKITDYRGGSDEYQEMRDFYTDRINYLAIPYQERRSA